MPLRFKALPSLEELQSRDRELRDLILAGSPREDSEGGLERHLVDEQALLLPDHRWLLAYEWEVKPGWSQYGRGDLVFADARGHLMAVETKWLRTHSGKTAKRKRNAGRNKVFSQALRYAEALWTWVPWAHSVEARVWTNEETAPRLIGVFPVVREGEGG